jgi:hypothetical protein
MDEKWTAGAHCIRFTSNPHAFYLLPPLRSVEQRQSDCQQQRFDPVDFHSVSCIYLYTLTGNLLSQSI